MSVKWPLSLSLFAIYIAQLLNKKQVFIYFYDYLNCNNIKIIFNISVITIYYTYIKKLQFAY